MKLSTRLIAVTVGTVLAASAVAGVLLVRMERAQLVKDEVNESRVLLRSLQVSIENSLRDGQAPDVAELLGRLELVAHEVDVLVFEPGQTQPALVSIGTDVDDESVREVRERVHTHDETTRLVEAGPGPARLVAGVALRTDEGEPMGTLVLSRPLNDLEADLQSTTMLTVLSVLVFAVATMLVMLVLLRREVTRPLARFATATELLGDDIGAALDLPPERSEELESLRATLLQLQAQLLAARDARREESERREQLERQLAEADKLIVVGQLASGVAHEIGSPLQILVGRARLLADDPDASDETRRQAELIEEHAARISSIVARLQDVVRRRPSQIRHIHLGDPVQKVIWLLEPEARRRGIALDFEAPAEPIPVLADPDEVQQIVLNLSFNALQATEREGSVTVSVEGGQDTATLRVQDTGRGMDEETRERAFEAFFTTRDQAGGTGLGLAVVKSIVDRHGASIALTSTPGVGTEVRVTWTGGAA